MRIARFIVPIALAGALVAGCADTSTFNPANNSLSPTPSPVPTSNGVDALEAKEILEKATAALKTAGSYRYKGDFTEEDVTVTMDVKVQGKDLHGTVVMPEMGTMEMLLIGSDFYFKADALMEMIVGMAGENADAFKGKWIKTTKDNKTVASFADLMDVEAMLDPDGEVTKGETTNINGTQAIGLKDSKGEGTLYIATVGEPYPLRIQGPEGEGAVDFSDFGATFEEIKAPSADQVIDLASLDK